MDENELVLLEKGPLEEIDKLLAAFISKVFNYICFSSCFSFYFFNSIDVFRIVNRLPSPI